MDDLEGAFERLAESPHPAARTYRTIAPAAIVAGILIFILFVAGRIRPRAVAGPKTEPRTPEAAGAADQGPLASQREVPPLRPQAVLGAPLVAASIFLFLVLTVVGASLLPRDADGHLPPLLAVVVQMGAHVGTAAFIIEVFRRSGGSLAGLGLGRAGAPEAALWGFLGFLASLPLVYPASEAWSALFRKLGGWSPEINGLIPILFAHRDLAGTALIVGMAGVVAPMSEEVFFRALIYRASSRWIGPRLGALASACLFAGVHPPVNWLPIVILGLFLAYVYERTGSLWAPITLHACHNLSMLAALLAARAVAP